MTKKYEWGLASFAKGINPNEAVKELGKIEKSYGSLTPEHILDAALPEASLFHSLFTWDDAKAANQYRLEQARRILNNVRVTIIADGQPRVIPVYEVVRFDGGNVYKHIDSFSVEDVEVVKTRTVRDLNALRQKLSLYKQFEVAVNKLGEVVEEISNI